MRVKRKNLLHQPQQKVSNDKGDSAWLSVENDIKHAVRCFLVLVSRGSTQSIGGLKVLKEYLTKKGTNKQINKQDTKKKDIVRVSSPRSKICVKFRKGKHKLQLIVDK